MSKIETYTSMAVDLLVAYGGKVLIALLVWFVGSFVIKRLLMVLEKALVSSKTEKTLASFLKSLAGVGLKVLLAIVVISMLGVQTTSLVALLGAAGLAVGLALQGSLANFAGGALILFFKPFVVGDRIQASGHDGVVEEIQIFNTILRTPNNQMIIIPNGTLSNTAMVNVTGNKQVGIELTFGIGYEDDIDKAKSIITSVIKDQALILDDPSHVIGVVELADSSVNIFTRSFVNSADYWTVYFYLQETVKKEFDNAGVSIPFPQRDVHMYNHN